MTNDRRLLLALLDHSDGDEFRLGYTRGELQVAISMVGNDCYALREGSITTYRSFASVIERLLAIEVI